METYVVYRRKLRAYIAFEDGAYTSAFEATQFSSRAEAERAARLGAYPENCEVHRVYLNLSVMDKWPVRNVSKY